MIHQSAGNGAVSAADRAPARAPGLPYGQLDASSALFAAASPQAPLLAPPSPQPLDLGPAAAEQPDALDKPSCPAFAGFSATHADRPRERLAALGPQGLSDAQLLAIFLGTGVAGKSATELGQTLIQRSGRCAVCSAHIRPRCGRFTASVPPKCRCCGPSASRPSVCSPMTCAVLKPR
jgi:hypothetical protein